MGESESAKRVSVQCDEQTMREWNEVMQRCPDLLPLFADVRLRVHDASAARILGLTKSNELRRQLLARRLPPFLVLRDWCLVVQLADRFGVDEGSLGHWAMRRGEYASVYYSFIKRVTGMLWSELRKRGPVWARRRALQMWRPHMEKDE